MGRSLEWRRSVRQLVAARWVQSDGGEGRRPCAACGVTISGRRIWRQRSGRPAAGTCRRCATIWSLVGRCPIPVGDEWEREQVLRIVVGWRSTGFDPATTYRTTLAGAALVLAAIDEWALRELVRLTPTVDRRELRWAPSYRVRPSRPARRRT